MNTLIPKKATIISAILAIILILLSYTLLATVDLVFVRDGEELFRQEDVRIISKIEAPEAAAPEGVLEQGEEISFTYVDGDDTVEYDHTSFKFKLKIAKTVIVNLKNIKWTPEGREIVLTVE